jgi:hypothetical protein
MNWSTAVWVLSALSAVVPVHSSRRHPLPNPRRKRASRHQLCPWPTSMENLSDSLTSDTSCCSRYYSRRWPSESACLSIMAGIHRPFGLLSLRSPRGEPPVHPATETMEDDGRNRSRLRGNSSRGARSLSYIHNLVSGSGHNTIMFLILRKRVTVVSAQCTLIM